jgi:ubiquinone/menaquinone biosynthesis C-methylase UbiE
MFFPEKIKSINPKDWVLEIGPGSAPHPRSDIYLEIKISDKAKAKFQRGNLNKIKYSKPIVYYDGKKFPFKTNEFDYVICSHVLEHLPNIKQFINEVFRVSKKGYFEYPTIVYDYIYNIEVHLNFLLHSNGSLYYLKKESTPLNKFRPVQNLLFESLNKGYNETVTSLINIMAQGFEWKNKFKIKEAKTISDVTPKNKIRVKISKEEKNLNFFKKHLIKW